MCSSSFQLVAGISYASEAALEGFNYFQAGTRIYQLKNNLKVYVFIEAMVTSVRPGKMGVLSFKIYLYHRKATPDHTKRIRTFKLPTHVQDYSWIRNLSIHGKLAGIGALVVSTSYHHITSRIITQDQTYITLFMKCIEIRY